MDNRFFEQPILNSPYEYPGQHWELDADGQPTQRIVGSRRPVSFVTPIPRPKKRRVDAQQQMVFADEAGLSTERQQYDPTPVINELRVRIDRWRQIPNPADWRVTPETARLLQHWRRKDLDVDRRFFCHVEALETTIWLTEVAPELADGRRFLDHLA